ncbi:HeH/LEM domain-containing protein [Metapseudomonas otitidis]|uniref:HeH/LEM domain-containing protein n=1 Tax=Metapseudomonas otitidis TaxID=319939 RepID=UPI00244BB773|nr:HeH/LEM domain-containing protein [Pseudomonas otitidis]MDG9780271.1 HeH/LEM domain-containing protein [Pseudomonas otitidis]
MNVLKCKPWGEGQGDHVLVNEEDFNPDFHQLFEDAEGEADRPSKGLNVEQLKAALVAKGVAVPEGAKKADLAKLLDQLPTE